MHRSTRSFIAMNRFKVVHGSEDAFEALWRGRETHLHEVEGFISFRLLRAPAGDDYTLFASHTIWASPAASTAEPAAVAPQATREATASGRGSNTRGCQPSRAARSAIGPPIDPRPMNPTVGR